MYKSAQRLSALQHCTTSSKPKIFGLWRWPTIRPVVSIPDNIDHIRVGHYVQTLDWPPWPQLPGPKLVTWLGSIYSIEVPTATEQQLRSVRWCAPPNVAQRLRGTMRSSQAHKIIAKIVQEVFHCKRRPFSSEESELVQKWFMDFRVRSLHCRVVRFFLTQAISKGHPGQG